MKQISRLEAAGVLRHVWIAIACTACIGSDQDASEADAAPAADAGDSGDAVASGDADAGAQDAADAGDTQAARCGDGQCGPSEDASSCPSDCFCGNHTCEVAEGPQTCPADCVCGNQACDGEETAESCPEDCWCGDLSCDRTEDQYICPVDCGAVGVYTSYSTSCAYLADGSVRCWPSLTDCQDCAMKPMRPSGLSNVVKIAVPYMDYPTGTGICALLTDGFVTCGQRADDGSTSWSLIPDLDDVVDVTNMEVTYGGASSWGNLFAIRADGEVLCVHSQTGERAADFAPQGALPGGKTISAEPEFGCGIAADGTVWCWGDNSLGQLGNGTTSYSSIPVRAMGLQDIVDLSVTTEGQGGCGTVIRKRETCAVDGDGDLWCWGCHPGCKPGVNTTKPTIVEGAVGLAAISLSSIGLLALDSEGAVYWSERPLSSEGWAPLPIEVPGRAVAIAGSRFYGCAALASGTACCWKWEQPCVEIGRW